MVRDLKELDKYPWAGHSAILGRCENPFIPKRNKGAASKSETEVTPCTMLSAPCGLAEKTIEDVLRYFGKDLKAARKEYREFVRKGISKGRQEELRGGGLVRSAGGTLFGLHNEDRDPPDSPERGQARDGGRGLSDDRILGSGDYACPVKQLHQS